MWRSSATRMMTSNRAWWGILAVLLLAAGLRILGTTDQSLWLDEGFTYNVIARAEQSWAAMFTEIRMDTHPPLYFVLLRLWTQVMGDSVLALRLFSGYTALISVAVVYRLGRRLGGDGVAVVAALLLTLWDADIFLAQETRMYAQRTLLAGLSMWFYLRWWRSPSVGRAIPWVLANTAMMYTQYLGGWVPLVQGLHALLMLRGRVRVAALGALAAAGVLFAPWFVGVTLQQAATPPTYEMLNAPPSSWETLTDLTRMYFGAVWVLLLALIIAGGGMYRADAPRLMLFGLWLLVPVAGTFAANTQFPLLMPRNLSLITPAAAVLVALGIGTLDQRARVLVLVGVVGYMLTTVDYFRPKPPWDQLGAAATGTADHAALMEVGNGGYPLQYYLDHVQPPFGAVLNLPRLRLDPPDDGPLLAATLNQYDTVWLAHWSPATEIFEVLQNADFQRTGTITIDHIGNELNMHRYDRLPADPLVAYENGLALYRAETHPDGVNLIWMPQTELTTDYSLSAFALNADGVLVRQYDTTPPTRTWEPGQPVFMSLPLAWPTLPPGDYQIAVKVYTWADGTVYQTVNGESFAVIDTVRINENR